MSERPPGEWLLAGVVGRPHGLDGSFLVAAPSALLLGAADTVHTGGRGRRIVRRAGHERRLILRLEGCESRESAEALRGQELLVSREDAPGLGPDEWWAEDLQGCLVTCAGRRVGVVRRLLTLPSCEVLEVQRDRGGEDLLVPLVHDAVGDVDVQGRTIEIELGFLEES
ncbi:MAG: ribosome maturation factor RimM [Solirubrobacteraceae bacterium]